MQNAIIINTLNGAVTEYDNFAFQSITATHGGGVTGLFAFGGNVDIDLPIVAVVQTPKTLRESTLKKSLEAVLFSMKGTGIGEATVFGESLQWPYEFPVLVSGQSRCKVGRGIRENYLGFGYRNPQGDTFKIDRIEVQMSESKNRRGV